MEGNNFIPSGSLRTPCSSVREVFSSQSEKAYKEFLFDALIRALKETVKLSISDKKCEEIKQHLVYGIDISCDLNSLGISHNFMDNVFVFEARDSLFLIRKYLFETIKSLSTIAIKYSRVMATNLRNCGYVGSGIISVGEETVLHIERLKEIINDIDRISANMQLSDFCNTIDSYNCFYSLYGSIGQIPSINQSIAGSCGFGSTSFNIYTPSYFLDMELISITKKVSTICIGVCLTFRNSIVKLHHSQDSEELFSNIKTSLTSERNQATRLIEQFNLTCYKQQSTFYSIHREAQYFTMLETLLLDLQDIIHYFLNKKVKKQITSLSYTSNQVSGVILDDCSKRIHEYVDKLKPFISKNESCIGKHK